MDRSAWPIGPRIGPLSVLWTTATGRVVAAAVVVVVVVDSATLEVVTVAGDAISGTTGISDHKVVVAAADIASSRAADIIRSVIRIMEGAVVVKMARANSRRPRPSRWCRRNL